MLPAFQGNLRKFWFALKDQTLFDERRTCYVALAVAAGVVAAVERTPALAGHTLVPMVWAAATALTLLAAVVARRRTEHRTDPKAERRLRFWNGPLGRWLFALARPRLTPLNGGAVSTATPPPVARGA